MSKQISQRLLWDNVSTTPGEVSEHIYMLGYDKIQVYGTSATGAGTAQIEVSHDVITWSETGQIIQLNTASDFFGKFDNNGVYIRVKVDAAFTGLTLRVNSEEH